MHLRPFTKAQNIKEKSEKMSAFISGIDYHQRHQKENKNTTSNWERLFAKHKTVKDEKSKCGKDVCKSTIKSQTKRKNKRRFMEEGTLSGS